MADKKPDPLKIFKERVKDWTDYFGLCFWDVDAHKDDEAEDNDLAYTMTHVGNKRADIYLVLDWDSTDIPQNELNNTAFHEVCETMLSEIRCLAAKRDIHYGEIHAIIRIF